VTLSASVNFLKPKELGIPDEIISKPPTADLWAGQTDEHEMGITYKELDKILVSLNNNDMNGHCPEKVELVKRLVNSSNHKRVPVPRFVKPK
jgi:NAD+ synthase